MSDKTQRIPLWEGGLFRDSPWLKFLENVSIVVKSSGLMLWLFLCLLCLLEVKRYYNIDVIPGYDSSIDDTYGMIRGLLSEFFRSLS